LKYWHGNYPAPDYASPWFSIIDHTEADGSTVGAVDTIYTGDPGADATGATPPFVPGSGYCPILMQWRVVEKTAIHDFPVTNQENEIFSTGKCESRKGAHTESTNYDDPKSTF
jgi:hypothetical protein